MRLELKKFLSLSIFAGLFAFAVVSFVVIYFATRRAIAQGFDEKMSGIGNVVSSMVAVSDLQTILSEKRENWKSSAAFMRYYTPLNATLTETDVSFLYMFYYGGSKDILYIVDATPMTDELWARPNSEENSVDADLKEGLLHAFRYTGGASELIDNDEWGLMKSGTYPIGNGSERSFYMTGVDVKIGEIITQTALVLTKAGVAFVVISIFALWIVSLFSKSISNSVNRVKNEVMKIGAGVPYQLELSSVPSDVESIAKTISDYAENAEKNLSAINSACSDVSRSAMLGRAKSVLIKESDEYSFVKSSENSKCVKFALYVNNTFFVFSFINEKSQSVGLLRQASISYLTGRVTAKEIFDTKLCSAISTFNSMGEPIECFGEKIKADFTFSKESSHASKAVFTFADGEYITAVGKGISI